MFATMALPAAILLVGLFFVPDKASRLRTVAITGAELKLLAWINSQAEGRAGVGGNPRGVGGGERRFPRIVAAGRAAGPGHRPAA